MCLIVAGHLRDYELFKDIFDNRIALNNITGNKIAVFLFCDRKEDVLSFVLDDKNNRRRYRCLIPGELINGIEATKNYHSIDSISNLTPNIKDEIIQKSQLVSEDIRVQFNIPIDKVPCILLVERGQRRENTYVIPTKGELDIQKFFKFLKELRQLLEAMPQLQKIESELNKLEILRSSYGTLEYTTKNLERIDDNLLDLTTELDLHINKSREILIDLGLDKRLANQIITSKNWDSVKSNFLSKNFGELTEQVDLDVIKNALYKREFRESIEKILLLGRRFAKIKKERKSWETRLNNTNERIEGLSNISTEKTNDAIQKAIVDMKSIKKEIEDIEKKYSRIFWRASKIRPLKDFIQNFLGFAKATKDVLSAEEAINKIINRN